MTHHKMINFSHLIEKTFIGENKRIKTDCITTLLSQITSINMIVGAVVRRKIRLVFPSKKFDIKDILDSIQKYKCTTLNSQPRALINILNYPQIKDYDLTSLELVISGGQMITTEILNRVKNEFNVKLFYIGYGMSETICTHANIIDFGGEDFDPNKYDGSIGRLVSNMEAKVIDPDTGDIVPLESQGVLCVRGYSLTKCYWDDPEMTLKAIDENGWLNTSDYVTMTKDGHILFKSRCKEVIEARVPGL
jgi:fatty-acyl-CoA synthase